MSQEQQVPKHIAIIMDGNGRWAKKRFLPRIAGHKQGVETLKEITKHANKLGVKILTVYAFSTENWTRPEEEVKFIMNLPKMFFNQFMPELIENNIRLTTIGDITYLPEETQKVLNEAIEKTQDSTGMILNIAINYGGYQEIISATKAIAKEIKEGIIEVEDINKDKIESHLMTHKFGEYANPDLLIRTSGEIRLSNFLLWQLAYSEFYFTDVLWPDFSVKDLDLAVETYHNRDRRYGSIDLKK